MKSIAEIRRENLRKISDALGSQISLAEKVGYESQRISRLITKKKDTPDRNIGEKVAERIEKSLHLPRYWLDHCNTMDKDQLKNYLEVREYTAENPGEAPNQTVTDGLDFVTSAIKDLTMDFLPFFDLKSSTEKGELVLDKEGHKMLITAERLNEMGLDPMRAGCVRVDNTQMEPTIKDKSDLVINLLKKTIESGKIYLVKLNNQFLIRRVFLEPDNSIRISCDNPVIKMEHPDITLTQEKAPTIFSTLGRVVSVVVSL